MVRRTYVQYRSAARPATGRVRRLVHLKKKTCMQYFYNGYTLLVARMLLNLVASDRVVGSYYGRIIQLYNVFLKNIVA